jgi:hydrogenase-4 component B
MNYFITLFMLLPLLIFLLNGNIKKLFSILFILLVSSITSFRAFEVLSTGKTAHFIIPWLNNPMLVFDSLSSFFIIIINIVVIAGIFYSGSYLKIYSNKKSSVSFSLHYFSFVWLHISMLLVCLIHEGFLFITVWELMTISSFILVTFDAEQKNILKTGINYLIQMHVGLVFLLAAFFWVEKQTGILGFDGLAIYFEKYNNLPVFLLFLIGFGIKAGFTPLHTWLPEAHPAAPSHVSGVMSGVMIKMGIYGILRVSTMLQTQLTTIGVIVLLLSLHSGIYGIMFAIVQRDLKRLLAFSSIENIGIIGIGIGVGLIGLGESNTTLIVLGFSGALLHVFNHSLFKSLLFFAAGAIYKATHTRNIDELGGLIHKMPKTAYVFLLGSLAITAMPPFNGFISELVIFSGLFNGIQSHSPFLIILFVVAITGLALISGMAVFCFTRAFGLTFLGSARSNIEPKEVDNSMIYPKIVLGVIIVVVGLVPIFFLNTVLSIVLHSFKNHGEQIFSNVCFCNYNNISIVTGIFILVVICLLLIRYFALKNKKIEHGPTWGCGYTAINSTHQYTSTSYVSEYAKLTRPVIGSKNHFNLFAEDEIFPKKRIFGFINIDRIKAYMIDSLSLKLVGGLRSLARLQTGRMQHYVLYALVFIILLLVLTFFNIL